MGILAYGCGQKKIYCWHLITLMHVTRVGDKNPSLTHINQEFKIFSLNPYVATSRISCSLIYHSREQKGSDFTTKAQGLTYVYKYIYRKRFNSSPTQ